MGDRMEMWRGSASMSLETRSEPDRAVAYGSLDLISQRQKIFIFQVHTRSKVNSALVVKSFCHLQESADHDFRKLFSKLHGGIGAGSI